MFKILKKSKLSHARLGRLETNHGVIETPFFMPDATRGGVKNLAITDLEKLGIQTMVVNTYHLYLQPGIKIIKKADGIHQFMSWNKSLLSDSGGYQVFSLIHKNKKTRLTSGESKQARLDSSKQVGKIYDNKVKFKSPFNGSQHELTPEKSMQIQFDLGTDMMVCLDDCPPNDYDEKQILDAVERTIRWARRCRQEYERQIKKRKLAKGNQPLLFGVVQGGINKKLRKKCADELIKIGFDGLGYGARPVDTKGIFLKNILEFTARSIPENYVRFGLGIGMPEDIVQCVKMGWDIFDCVIPTREARHGRLYAPACPEEPRRMSGRRRIPQNKDILLKQAPCLFYKIININNAKYVKDFKPINPVSKFSELKKYTKAYLHHLFKINEPLAQRLATLNNLEFYLDLMAKIRENIEKGKL